MKVEGSGSRGESDRSEPGDNSSSSYKPKLTVRTKSTDGNILLEIEDNGLGIPDDLQDKIMMPFFTTKKGTEGTGLGLSITHDIIKAHGGRLDLESTTGEGTIFSITIPVDHLNYRKES